MTLSKARFIFLWPFYLQVLLVNCCLRLLLAWQELTAGDEFWSILFWGTVHDTLFFSYFAIPLVIYLWFTPGKVFIHISNKGTLQFLNALSATCLTVFAIFEFGFWQTHHSRFNDVLVKEILADKRFIETALKGENLFLLIPLSLFFICVLWFITSTFFNHYLKKQMMVYSNFRFRILPALFFLSLPASAFYFLEYKQYSLMPIETHFVKEQLKENGSYQFARMIYQIKVLKN